VTPPLQPKRDKTLGPQIKDDVRLKGGEAFPSKNHCTGNRPARGRGGVPKRSFVGFLTHWKKKDGGIKRRNNLESQSTVHTQQKDYLGEVGQAPRGRKKSPMGVKKKVGYADQSTPWFFRVQLPEKRSLRKTNSLAFVLGEVTSF